MRDRLMGVLAVVFVATSGCADSEVRVAVYPVSGQVFYDGRPAAGVSVYLAPTSAPTVPEVPANPHGVTGPDGRFTLTTYAPGDGAAAGGYQVLLMWLPPVKDGEEAEESDRLLGWYGPVHSKLTVLVVPGGNAIPPFKLPATSKVPGVVEGVPGRN